MEKRKKLKKGRKLVRVNSGITLIALIVTIIVLLILAGVTLSLISGSNGILKRASDAVDANKEGTAKEQVELKLAEFQTDYFTEKYIDRTNEGTKKDYILDKLTEGIRTQDFYAKASDDGTVKVYEGKDISGEIILTGEIQEDGSIKWKEKIRGINIDYTTNPSGYTNGNIILTVSASSTDGKITGLQEPSNLTKNADGTYTITQNGSYQFIATDSTGASKVQMIEIQKIDKVLPKDFTPEMESITKKGFTILANAEDGDTTAESVKSGIGKYKYYVKSVSAANYDEYETTSGKYVLTGLEMGKEYDIYVVAYDKAGNSKESAYITCQTKDDGLDYPILTSRGIMNCKDENGNYYLYANTLTKAADSIGYAAFDKNTNSYVDFIEARTMYLEMDRSVSGRTMSVNWADTTSFAHITMNVLNKDKSQVLYSVESAPGLTEETVSVNITGEMCWVQFVYTSDTSYDAPGNLMIREITLN